MSIACASTVKGGVYCRCVRAPRRQIVTGSRIGAQKYRAGSKSALRARGKRSSTAKSTLRLGPLSGKRARVELIPHETVFTSIEARRRGSNGGAPNRWPGYTRRKLCVRSFHFSIRIRMDGRTPPSRLRHVRIRDVRSLITTGYARRLEHGGLRNRRSICSTRRDLVSFLQPINLVRRIGPDSSLVRCNPIDGETAP